MKIEIEVEYNINDEVYVLYGGTIRRAIVREIRSIFKKGNSFPEIRYKFDILRKNTITDGIETEYFPTELSGIVFNTKKEAVFHWLEKNGVNPIEMLQGYFSG